MSRADSKSRAPSLRKQEPLAAAALAAPRRVSRSVSFLSCPLVTLIFLMHFIRCLMLYKPPAQKSSGSINHSPKLCTHSKGT